MKLIVEVRAFKYRIIPALEIFHDVSISTELHTVIF